MYRIYADDNLIYDSRLDDSILTKADLTLEVNKSGSFEFTMYSDNPFYSVIQRLKTIITVYKNDNLIYRGRVINDVTGFFKNKTFTCEGELSFLLDSIIRPFEYKGSPKELFKKFITEHNSQVEAVKRFDIGAVTVTDPNDYIDRSNDSYEDTFTNIQNRLLDTHGGYIVITPGVNGRRVINWFAKIPYKSNQKIEFGENLLDFTKTVKGEDIATGLIPLGAKPEGSDKPITIADVNKGLDYIVDKTAAAKYGRIFVTNTWDDVTEPKNLLTKGTQYLQDIIKSNITIDLTAIDLSLLDKSIDDFSLGDYITIVSGPHGLNDEYMLEKQTIDLLKPDNDKITLGYTYSTFTEHNINNVQKVEKLVDFDAEKVNREMTALNSKLNTSNKTVDEIKSYIKYDEDALLFNGGVEELDGQGSCLLSNGLLLTWGTVEMTDTYAIVTFPQEYKNTPTITTTVLGKMNSNVMVSGLTARSCTITATSGTTFTWQAIGLKK